MIVRDLSSNHDTFVCAYFASTRTVSISLANGLNFRLKIPTDEESAKNMNNSWSVNDTPCHNIDPVSIHFLLRLCS